MIAIIYSALLCSVVTGVTRISPEGLLVGDVVRLEGIVIRPFGKFELALFHNALNFHDGLSRRTKVLSISLDFASKLFKISLPQDQSTPSIDGAIYPKNRPFALEVRFRMYNGNAALEVASTELGILEDLHVQLPLVQLIEGSGDMEKIGSFEIDHNARRPMLRNVRFGMGDFIEFNFTTSDSWMSFYLNTRSRDTIPLQILFISQYKKITFNAYNITKWGHEAIGFADLLPNTEHILKIVNGIKGIDAFLDQNRKYTFNHRTKYPYKDYVELFSDSGRGSVNRVRHGKEP